MDLHVYYLLDVNQQLNYWDALTFIPQLWDALKMTNFHCSMYYQIKLHNMDSFSDNMFDSLVRHAVTGSYSKAKF